jgi:hypothetical protein
MSWFVGVVVVVVAVVVVYFLLLHGYFGPLPQIYWKRQLIVSIAMHIPKIR